MRCTKICARREVLIFRCPELAEDGTCQNIADFCGFNLPVTYCGITIQECGSGDAAWFVSEACGFNMCFKTPREALVSKAIKCFETVLKNLPASEQAPLRRSASDRLISTKCHLEVSLKFV